MIILGIQKNKLSVLPLYSNVYDDATDFKICEFDKNTKMKISREQNNFFFSKKKKKLLTAHQGLIYCKKKFVAEETFGRRSQNQTKNKIVEEKSQVSP